jgi:hypothetical protein
VATIAAPRHGVSELFDDVFFEPTTNRRQGSGAYFDHNAICSRN